MMITAAHSARSADWPHAEARGSCADSVGGRQCRDVPYKWLISAAVVVHLCLRGTTLRCDVVRRCAAGRGGEADELDPLFVPHMPPGPHAARDLRRHCNP